MSDSITLLETVLRGAAAGLSVLMAVVLATTGSGQRTRRLGALFTFSVGIYVLVSGEQTKSLFGIFLEPAILISIWGTVFFWWFAASLFDDDFRWRWWRIAPLIVLPGLHYIRLFLEPGAISTGFIYTHLIFNALLFGDALRLALITSSDDLVSQRRQFRVAAAFIIGVFGVGIALAEIIEQSLLQPFPNTLLLFQAAAIASLNLFFGVWLLSPRVSLFSEISRVTTDFSVNKQSVPVSDRPAYERLKALMDEGIYRSEGLTVEGLANKIGMPEHQLRKLINGALGYRNFSAFLNARRIEDAKAILADPIHARKQILQIALDLGFGSISPFNRAFKNTTGMTPSEFRKQALAQDKAKLENSGRI